MYAKDCGICEYLKRIMPTEEHGNLLCDKVLLPLEFVNWCGIPFAGEGIKDHIDQIKIGNLCYCGGDKGHNAGTLPNGKDLIICNKCGLEMGNNNASDWDA